MATKNETSTKTEVEKEQDKEQERVQDVESKLVKESTEKEEGKAIVTDNETVVEKIQEQFQNVKSKYKVLQQKRAELLELEKQCSKVVSKARLAIKDEKDAFKTKERINEFKSMTSSLYDMASTFPQSPTFFLKMIIGDINVTLNSNESRLLYKQEYEKFKMVNIVIILILCVVSLVLYESMIPSALAHIASVWYYSTITLRELVLKTNGSRIKWWWLLHHYCSIFMAVVFLMWPPGGCYNRFKPQFMLFSIALSCVMALQFRYQRAKLYRHVAMGRSHRMTVSQESQVSLVFDFTFLVVCLIGIYIFQLYNGYTLITYIWNHADCFMWQVMILSVMFFALGLLNFFTLLNVLHTKRTSK